MAEGTDQTVEAAAKHELDKSPHARYSSFWCRRCMEIGLHPANGNEIRDVLTPLIRAAVVTECAQAIEAERATPLNDEFDVGEGYGLRRAAALVRALVSPLEGDKT